MPKATPAVPRAATKRGAAPVRDVLASLRLPAREARALNALVRRALEGPAAERREAHRALLQAPPAAPLSLVPLVLATRDELVRSDARPRGLSRHVDQLLLALAEAGRRRAPVARPRRPDRAGRLLRRLLDLAPDGVLTVRASGRVGLWNRAATAMTGRRRRAVVRLGAEGLFADPTVLPEVLAALAEGRRVEPRETALVGARDEEVPVRLLATSLDLGGSAHPDPDRHLLVFHDLTEVHRIRRRLIDTEKLSAMAKIAGSVAHEFRNPLNSLFLSTDLLEDELAGTGAPEEAIAPTLAAIREEIERLNEIIRHYLSLSKVASHAPEIIDLGELVSEFAEGWRERASARGVELKVRVQEGDLLVSVDPNQVRRVLVNLMENAIDALVGEDPETAEGGRSAGAVSLIVRPLSRSVKLTVRDDGPGIAADMRDRVFEPFYTSKSRGSGLGLYLVREIVLAHGGSISLGAHGARGTSILMHWPRPSETPT